MRPTPGSWLPRGGLLLAVLLGLGLAGCVTFTTTDSGRTTDSGTATAAASARSGLPLVSYETLPPEAHETLRRIEAGGPYPYRRDDTLFGNRERLLPGKPHGYYREYTVATPGESDRGARRIVVGSAGERYYTDDHYASFREVVGP